MRDPRLDNAKAVLITAVVLGHLLESVQGWQNQTLRAALTFIYLFHMPAFIFLAGITAKRQGILPRVLNLAVLLVAFQALYTLPVVALKGEYPVGALTPYWMLWFLLSMIAWQLALPLLLRLGQALPIAIAIALAAGLAPWIGYPLAASRTLVFFPFFVAGHLYGRQVLQALPGSLAAKALAALLLGGLTVCLYRNGIDHPWLNGYAGYAELGVDALTGPPLRLAVLFAAALATLAFLTFIGSRPGRLGSVGETSLAVFLLHGFLVKACATPLGWLWREYGAGAALTGASLMAVLIVWILARPALDGAIRKLASGASGLAKKSVAALMP